MAYEVEIKAHAYPELKEVIDSYVKCEGHPVEKDDTYYAFPGDITPRFRIRDEGDKLLITAKKNHREEGIECNKELEFVHENRGDKPIMEEMADMLGYKVFIKKHKKGWEWHYGPVHIELLDVLHLGWYLEMETISPYSNIEENRERVAALYMILEGVGLSACDVESNSYQKMLADYEKKHQGSDKEKA